MTEVTLTPSFLSPDGQEGMQASGVLLRGQRGRCGRILGSEAGHPRYHRAPRKHLHAGGEAAGGGGGRGPADWEGLG